MPTLKELRDKQNLSASQLAKRSGIHMITIYSIERGNYWPTTRTIRALAKALGVKPEDIEF